MSNTPSKKDVDDLVYALRQKGDDSTYALVVEALAKWRTPQPVVREPLTDEQIKDEASHHGFIGSTEMLVKFVRGIEAAHGIKGGQHGAE